MIDKYALAQKLNHRIGGLTAVMRVAQAPRVDKIYTVAVFAMLDVSVTEKRQVAAVFLCSSVKLIKAPLHPLNMPVAVKNPMPAVALGYTNKLLHRAIVAVACNSKNLLFGIEIQHILNIADAVP